MARRKVSEKERRGRAIRKAVSRIMADSGLKYQKEFAARCGITETRFSNLSVSGFVSLTFDEFCKIAAMGMTTQEVCEATGRVCK